MISKPAVQKHAHRGQEADMKEQKQGLVQTSEPGTTDLSAGKGAHFLGLPCVDTRISDFSKKWEFLLKKKTLFKIP